MAIVVRDENRLGRVVEDRPQQQLKLSGAVFVEPLGVSLLDAGGPHAIFLAPSIQGAHAAERRRQRTPKISRKQVGSREWR
jgi:hypothetical protein